MGTMKFFKPVHRRGEKRKMFWRGWGRPERKRGGGGARKGGRGHEKKKERKRASNLTGNADFYGEKKNREPRAKWRGKPPKKKRRKGRGSSVPGRGESL